MPNNLIRFEWDFAKTGYCWQKDWESGLESYEIVGFNRFGRTEPVQPGEQFLVANSEAFDPPESEKYSPLDATGLFLEFADVEIEEGPVLAFANRHGLLTGGDAIVLSPGDDGLEFPGEPGSLWVLELQKMKFLVGLWRLVEAKDRKGLRSMVGWKEFEGLPGFQFGGEDTGFEQLWKPWPRQGVRTTPQDPLPPARQLLRELINESLSGDVDLQLITDAREVRPNLYLVPRDLRSAMWLQFARAVSGDKEYQRCEQCGNWFEIASAEGGRTDKKFCSTACRARKWRTERGVVRKRNRE